THFPYTTLFRSGQGRSIGSGTTTLAFQSQRSGGRKGEAEFEIEGIEFKAGTGATGAGTHEECRERRPWPAGGSAGVVKENSGNWQRRPESTGSAERRDCAVE